MAVDSPFYACARCDDGRAPLSNERQMNDFSNVKNDFLGAAPHWT
jgi:hypothetical protein